MKNRLSKFFNESSSSANNNNSRFFIACEFKPYSRLWSVLDSFAYDIKPAFIHGKLGILCYQPPAYGIVSIDDEDEPLIGYSFTITEPDTISLLDKIKGYNGQNAFNYHNKILACVFTDKTSVITAWAYVLSKYALEAYEQIQQVEFGIHDQNDKKQWALLDKITKSD